MGSNIGNAHDEAIGDHRQMKEGAATNVSRNGAANVG
jgi:hypothetical protein